MNTQYLVVWQHARDVTRIDTLGRQCFRGSLSCLWTRMKLQLREHMVICFWIFSQPHHELRVRNRVLGECEDRFTRIIRIENGLMEIFALVPQSNHDNYGLNDP